MTITALIAANAADDFSFWKIFGGVVTFLIGNVIIDRIRLSLRMRRLKNALLTDCLETLYKFGTKPETESSSDKTKEKDKGQFWCCRIPPCDDAKDWEHIRTLCRGYVLCPPLEDAKELVTCVKDWEARLVVRFYERWQLFVAFEKLYSEVHAQLVTLIATCCAKPDEAKELRHMKDECWEQLSGALEDMQETSLEMCSFSCKLFRAFTWPSNEEIDRLSEHRWPTLCDMEREAAIYEKAIADCKAAKEKAAEDSEKASEIKLANVPA